MKTTFILAQNDPTIKTKFRENKILILIISYNPDKCTTGLAPAVPRLERI